MKVKLIHLLNKKYKNILQNDKIPKFIRVLLSFPINWFFQGILFMDKTEKMCKILFSFFLTISLYFLVKKMWAISTIKVFFLSFIVAHSLNLIFNGDVFFLLKNLNLVNKKPEEYFNYAWYLKEKTMKEKWVLCAAIYGSASRGKLTSSSDLDIRIVRKSGLRNAVNACKFVMQERTIAFFKKFPLDIFILDDVNNLKSFARDNIPIILHDPQQILRKIYREVKKLPEFSGRL